MRNGKLSLNPSAVFEVIGDDVIVHLRASDDVIRLSGAQARAVVAIAAGEEIFEISDEDIDELVACGIVTAAGFVTRRSLLRTGALGAATGLAVVALPSVAAASSPVSLLGGWVFAGEDEKLEPTPGGNFFELFILFGDFPTEGSPSALTVDGQSYDLISASGGTNSVISWQRDTGSTTEGTRTTRTGTFSWAGVNYVVTFPYGLDGG